MCQLSCTHGFDVFNNPLGMRSYPTLQVGQLGLLESRLLVEGQNQGRALPGGSRAPDVLFASPACEDFLGSVEP